MSNKNEIGTLANPAALGELLLNVAASQEAGEPQMLSLAQLYTAAEILFGSDALELIPAFTPRDIQARASELKGKRDSIQS